MISAITALSVVTSSIVFMSAPVHAGQTTDATCSVTGANSFVVEGRQMMLVSDSIGPIAATIPAGEYTVDYVSYDNHTGHGGQNQNEETWTFTATNNNSEVYTSAPTADIPEETDIVTGSFGKVTLTDSVDAITFDHTVRSWNDSTSPESVYPVCVSFTPVDQPACEYDETILATDDNCNEPQILGEVTPTVTELPNTGAASIAVSIMSISTLSASMKAWIDSRKQ